MKVRKCGQVRKCLRSIVLGVISNNLGNNAMCSGILLCHYQNSILSSICLYSSLQCSRVDHSNEWARRI